MPDSNDEIDAVELTEDETLNALRHFKRLKYWNMEREEKLRQQSLKRLKAQEPWTYEQLKADVLQRASQLPFEFKIDSDNEHVFHLLCLFFSNNPEFEQFGYKSGKNGEQINYSLKKGIALISGEKGTGKSILMHLFSRNKKRPYLPIRTQNIASEFEKRGSEVVEMYSKHLFIAENPALFYCQYPGICFEDLGMEQDKNNYGNKGNVILEILFNLYERNQLIGDFSSWHLTSNKSGREFEERYDDRIRSRMRSMFNLIELPGKDRRR